MPYHSTFSKNRLGHFRDSDLLRELFGTTARRCAEGLVGGEGYTRTRRTKFARLREERGLTQEQVEERSGYIQSERTNSCPKGFRPDNAAFALAAFWSTLILGRILFAVLARRLPVRLVYIGLPLLLALAFQPAARAMEWSRAWRLSRLSAWLARQSCAELELRRPRVFRAVGNDARCADCHLSAWLWHRCIWRRIAC